MFDIRDAAFFSRFQLRFAQNGKQQSLFVTHHYTVSRFYDQMFKFAHISLSRFEAFHASVKKINFKFI